MATKQVSIDQKNKQFWTTLCGSNLARQLGISDDSPESLKKFDDWFLDFYPYLAEHVPLQEMRSKRVLEVGLGYGTLSQQIAEAGAAYTGLDIAEGPVSMVNHRLRQKGLPGEVLVGSILETPFADESFDFVVSIGCFHHTGDIARAIDESWRLLRSDGRMIVMVYNAYSYQHILTEPLGAMRYLLWDRLGVGRPGPATDAGRAAYDTDSNGEPAPCTDFISRGQLRRMCRNFSSVHMKLENMGDHFSRIGLSRERLLHWSTQRLFGTDIYLTAEK